MSTHADVPDLRLPSSRGGKPTPLAFAWQIATRDLRASFRASLLSTMRTLLQPLLQTAVFWVLFRQITRSDFGHQEGGYALFALAGLGVWGFFAAIVTGASGSLSRNAALIRRVPFPRESIVYASAFQPCLQLAVSFAAFSLLLTGHHELSSRLWRLLWLAPLLAIVALLALGLAFFVAAICAIGREGQALVPSVVQLWFFATPIVYPAASAPPWLARTFAWNPMAVIIDALRDTLLEGRAPDGPAVLGVALLTVAVFLIGRGLFRRLEHILPDVL